MGRILPLILSLAGLALTSPAQAHDVSGSDVKVYVQGESIEVWQSTPHGVVHELVHDLILAQQKTDGEPALEQARLDEIAMIEISKGWIILSNKDQPCPLARQAIRRVHNDEYLQMRYLFTCPESQTPAQLSMPWLEETPRDHIITLWMDQGRGERTYYVDRPNYTFPIGQ